MRRSDSIFSKGVQRREDRRRKGTITGVKRYRGNITKHETNLLELMEDAAEDRERQTLVIVEFERIVTKNEVTEWITRDRDNATGVLRE